MNARHLLILTIAGAAAGLGTSASAYTTGAFWIPGHTSMRAASNSFPEGNSYRTSLGTVVNRFNENPSNFYFTQTYNDGSVSLGNGQSEVWFSADPDYSPAVTFSWYLLIGGVFLAETDIVFYNGVSYTTSMNKTTLRSYGGARRPFETTAMHEYGHAAGLGHEDDEYNIMGEDWTHLSLNGSTCRSYVGEDAGDGLVSLYGRYRGGSIEDVGVVHWEWAGRDGAYSEHRQTRMFNESGRMLLPSSAFDGQRRYNVSRGQRVQVEFSYENNGETTRTVNVGYYISTNNHISTSDTRIWSKSMRLVRNNVSTTTQVLTIPWNLTSGQTYYIGVIVDYDNRLSEITFDNNAAYHVIRVN